MDTPPVTVSPQREVRLRADLLVALIVAAVSAGFAWFTVQASAAEIAPLRARVEAHDAALARLDVMANDIAWIKAELARQRHTEK